jgi:1-phosphofructokinase family hexose kinase
MILTVTPNAALDLTWWVDRIEPGATHRVPSGMARAGGKSLNVARVAHQQGAAVLAIATAGGTTGAELELELRASGLPHELVPVAASTRRSLALYDAGNDETSIFNEFGENHSDAEWRQLLDAVDAALAGAACLVGSGSLPPGSPGRGHGGAGYDSADFYPALVRMAAASGIPSIIDTSGTALLAAADAGATVLTPNRDELIAATDIGDPIRAARSLIARGAGLVLLSLGSAGMIAVDSGAEYLSARLPEPLIGNPTGAGDAAVAAVASCFAESASSAPGSEGISTEAILRRATAWSAAAVLMPLAGEISPLHVELAERLIIERHPFPPATESPS